jgi:hypothetical protein
MGGVGLRDWFQTELREMQEVTIMVLSPTAIRIAPRSTAGDLALAV